MSSVLLLPKHFLYVCACVFGCAYVCVHISKCVFARVCWGVYVIWVFVYLCYSSLALFQSTLHYDEFQNEAVLK